MATCLSLGCMQGIRLDNYRQFCSLRLPQRAEALSSQAGPRWDLVAEAFFYRVFPKQIKGI